MASGLVGSSAIARSVCSTAALSRGRARSRSSRERRGPLRSPDRAQALSSIASSCQAIAFFNGSPAICHFQLVCIGEVGPSCRVTRVDRERLIELRDRSLDGLRSTLTEARARLQ